ncbi:MAG: glycosyltransferase family 2 protein [Methanobrevibacter sp.]|uniref:glycosyltransferase family 2 protein n=1 Tax=Methanobrevibacter sp. TaxID=66852 RepID=UPI0026DF9172|nr:glycosyltransferase family 2 protein [Methanobrevibacter sp.]MDO5848655.1 glycosyltransferase family 2 protein [Methanobrevibacter sp.]
MSSQISVVIPVYNQEKYLKECLDSVVNQTIGIENIEVIAVNDKSTDKSLDILNEYANKYPSFKIISHEENKGAGAAKNTGIKHVTSDYLTFLDSDDFLEKDALKSSLNLIKDNNCDLLLFNWKLYPIDEESIHKPNIAKNQIIESISEMPALIYATSTGSKIFHKSLYGFLNFSDISYDDNIMSVESLLNSRRTFLSENIGYFYRKNSESVTSKITLKSPLDLAISIGELFDLADVYQKEGKYIRLLILKFMDDILFWLYHYDWSSDEKLKIVNSLNNLGDISKQDIEFYNELNSSKLLYGEDILDLGKYGAQEFLDKYEEYNKSRLIGVAKLYVDTGNGFNENESIEVVFNNEEENEISFNLNSFENVRRLRFDPISDEYVKVHISNIESDCRKIKIASSNCDNGLDDIYQYFNTHDPMYILTGDFDLISYIKFSFSLNLLNDLELKELLRKKNKFVGTVKSIIKNKFF